MNNKGLSAIIMTILMIGLVLVAVGIVWGIVSNVIEGQSESLDYEQMCLGINLNVKNLNCNSDNCSFDVERQLGSKGNGIEGIAVTYSNDDESSEEDIISGNIPVSRSFTRDHDLDSDATRIDVRMYVLKEDDTNHYCSQTTSS